ncbi:hypothetical protein F2P56_033072 [Juglans regia]|uniref:Uncharacterized protein LOC108985838 n=2 Tax=Juglans regia TaxID=51240 RepID=A0A2I4E361_JUGRE|nr:uncharacterized protein LOC108985838 [Juglans regia]KAF5447521.1 hypothetical protein F2P56_033072 [Juglans regia]
MGGKNGYFRFGARVVRGRWFMLFGAMLIMCGSGQTYIYSTYSKAIQTTLGYDGEEMDIITFCRDVAAYVAIFGGLVCEVAPSWVVLLIGAVLNFGGFIMTWLAVMHKIQRPPAWQTGVYVALGTASPNFAHTIALATCVKNFPESRGVVLGLMKGLVGLNAAIFTQIYLGFYANDPRGLILVTAVFPTIFYLGFMFTIRTIEADRQPNELREFLNFFYLTIVLALFLMIMTLLDKYIVVTRNGHVIGAAVVFILLLLPLYLVIKQEAALSKLETHDHLNYPTRDEVSAIDKKPQASAAPQQEHNTPSSSVSCFANIFKKPERGEDHSILQAVFSVDMVYIFFITLCGYGTGLTAYDHFGRLGQALAKRERLVSSIVSLVSIWNYYGRVYSGFLSELLLLKWKVPRSIVSTVMLVLQSIGLLLFAYPEIPGAYYVASVTLGFTLGAQVPIYLAIISEFFGLKYYATLLNFAQLYCPLALYLMNTKFTRVIYAKEAIKDVIAQGKDPALVKDPVCEGSHCYRLSFSILALIAFIGALISLKFASRTREFYKGDLYKKFRNENRRDGDMLIRRFGGEKYMKFGEAQGKAISETQMAQHCNKR